MKMIVLLLTESFDSCDAPEIPHAVIISGGYKEVFAADSFVQYECKDGYTAEGAEKKLICIGGTWSEGPTCSKSTMCLYTLYFLI